MTPEQHAALVRSQREGLIAYLKLRGLDNASVGATMDLVDEMISRAYGDGVEFGVQKERTAAQFRIRQI